MPKKADSTKGPSLYAPYCISTNAEGLVEANEKDEQPA